MIGRPEPVDMPLKIGTAVAPRESEIAERTPVFQRELAHQRGVAPTEGTNTLIPGLDLMTGVPGTGADHVFIDTVLTTPVTPFALYTFAAPAAVVRWHRREVRQG